VAKKLSVPIGSQPSMLGLFGLGQLIQCETLNLPAIIETAASLGIPAVETGFPELCSNAQVACSTLRDALSGAMGQLEMCINVPLCSGCGVTAYHDALRQKLNLLGLYQADACTFGPVSRNLVASLKENGFALFLQEVLGSGSIRRAGLWVTDRAEVLQDALDAFPQLSYVRFDNSPAEFLARPGNYGYTICAKRGIPVVNGDYSMDGRLLHALPPEAEEIWKVAGQPYTLADQLLRWTVQTDFNQQIILRPDSVEELSDMYAALSNTPKQKIPIKEQLLCNNLRDACMHARPVDCTACGCCMPCECCGVDIPETVSLYNDSVLFRDTSIPARMYTLLAHEDFPCIGCGQCKKYCPRRHPLMEIMAETAQWSRRNS